MKKLLLLLTVLAIAGTSSTQLVAQNQEKSDLERTISVAGEATREVVPDEIYLKIVIRERMESREKLTIEQQEEAMVKGLAEIGVTFDDLSLSDAQGRFVRVRMGKKDLMKSAEYELMVADAVTAAKVFEKLDDLDISQVDIDRVSHSQIEEYEKEVYIESIKNAKEKADYLLGAIGSTTGKPLTVAEGRSAIPSFGGQAQTVARQGGAFLYDSDYAQDKVSFKTNLKFDKITIYRAVSVVFEIE